MASCPNLASTFREHYPNPYDYVKALLGLGVQQNVIYKMLVDIDFKVINKDDGNAISGGMLTECFKHIRASIPQNEGELKLLKEETIYGNEITSTAKITKMNMILMGNSICVQHCLRALKDTEDARAIIIVPEGFLTANAYSKVRKFLLEKYSLHSVVSLPHGTFKPYTDVKMSILVFKNRKSNSKDIWYYKIKDDGYTLNTKRKKKNGSNDFDILLAERNLDTENIKFLTEIGFSVLKFKDLKENKYNLTLTEYDSIQYDSQFNLIKLEKLVFEAKKRNGDSNLPVWSVTNDNGFIASEERFNEQVASDNKSNYKFVEPNSFAYNPSRINVGSIVLNETQDFGCVSPMYVVFEVEEEKVLPKYLKYIFETSPMKNIINELASGSVRKTLNFKKLLVVSVPIPSIEKQSKIINEIENYEKIINCSSEIINSYIPIISESDNGTEYSLSEIVTEMKTDLLVGIIVKMQNNLYILDQ